MKKILMLACFSVLLMSVAVFASTQTVMGVVKSVNSKANSMVVTVDKKDHTIMYNKATVVKVHDAKAMDKGHKDKKGKMDKGKMDKGKSANQMMAGSISDVKAGSKVTVVFMMDNKNKVAKEVHVM